MPPVIAAITVALTPALGSFFAGLVAYVAVSGLVMAASSLLAPSRKGKSASKNEIDTTHANGPTRSPFGVAADEARSFCYGRGATGGTIKYWECTGTDNSDLWFVVAVHDTPIDSFEAFYVNNVAASFTSNAVTTAAYLKSGSPMMWLYNHEGAESQTADATLVAASASRWTTNHRLRGVAYYVWKMKYDTAIYSTGIPTPLVVLKGRKIYDPRKDTAYGGTGSHDEDTESTWEWSDNAALCLLDYLRGPKINGIRIGGCGVPIDQIDLYSFQAAAAVCDEAVSLAAGGTEDRYTINGFVTTLEDKASVVQSMLQAMNGMLTFNAGRLQLIAGEAQTSVLSLDDDDLAGALTVNPSTSRQSKTNAITSVYAEPSQLYQTVSAPPLYDSGYETADGGLHLETEIRHRFTTSVTTVERLNKLILANFREQLVIDAVYKPVAVQISVGDTFTFSSTTAGITNQKMLCLQRDLQADGSVKIHARQETDAKYSWSTGEEIASPTFTVHNSIDPTTITAPVSGDNTVAGVSLTATSGAGLPGIRITLAIPNSPFVKKIVTQFKLSADSAWSNGPSYESPSATAQITITGLAPSTNYDVRIAYVTVFGQSSWTTYSTITSGSTLKASAIVDGGVTSDSLAAGIEPVQVVTTIASAVTATSLVAFATDTAKLYRYNGASWVTVVDSNDLGSGSVTTAKLAAGAVTANELAANSIVSGKIATGAVNAGTIIADNIVVTGHLTANSVTLISSANGTGDTSITVTISADTYKVIIFVGAHDGSGNSYELYRDGASISPVASFGGIVGTYGCVFADAPSSGSKTYAIHAFGTSLTDSILVVMQLKR